MKRVLLTVAVALLIPGVLIAQELPTLGLYYDGVQHATPTGVGPFETFKIYLVLVQWHGYYVKGVEFALYTPDDDIHGTPRRIVVENEIMPSNFQIKTGTLWYDQAYTYTPPFTGYPDGYDVLATYECWMTQECYSGPEMWNYRVVVGPNADSGYLRGTQGPANELFDIRGLTFYLCPEGPIATEEESWGAIKAMYR
jgi:hypothetical protein